MADIPQVFYCAAPLSGAFGGLLATGLAEIEFHGYNGWPWIFFVEGSLTILVAIAAFFFLPDTPGKAKFLSEEEQWYIVHVLRADLGLQGDAPTDKNDEEKFSWAAVSLILLQSIFQTSSLTLRRYAWPSSTSTPY
jgi:MFS family permease